MKYSQLHDQFGDDERKESYNEIRTKAFDDSAQHPSKLLIQTKFANESDEIVSYGSINVYTKLDFNNKKSHISLYIIIFSVLISDMTRGILFPSLWLMVQSMGGNKISQGYAVAAFSAGRIIASPIFGYLSDIYGYKFVMMLCSFIIIMGSLIYSSSSSIQLLIVGQLFMGFGAGNLGAARAYVAEYTARKKRTEQLAFLTAVQYSGFTVTPIIGAMITSNNQNLHAYIGFIHINKFTLPAIFVAFCSTCCLFMFLIMFKDVNRNDASLEISQIELNSVHPMDSTEEKKMLANIEEVQLTNAEDILEPENNLIRKVIIGGCLLNIATKGTIGVFETIGLEFVIRNYNWSGLHAGLLISGCGLIGVFSLLNFRIILKIVSDVKLVLWGIGTMIISCLLITKFSSHSTVSYIQFYFSILLMYGIGYPIGHTALIGVYSKVTKFGPQGTLQGLFAAFGSLARVVFPIIAGYADDNSMFILMTSVLVVSYIVYYWFEDIISQVVSK
eukprot:gene8453-11431_t